MKKKIYLFIAALMTSVLFSGTARQVLDNDCYSSMGYPHEVAVYADELLDLADKGIITYDEMEERIHAAENEYYQRNGVAGEPAPAPEPEPSYTTEVVEQPAQPETPQYEPKANTGKTQKKKNTEATEPTPEPEPKKTYSHEYDSITDEAKEAFIAFTDDGEPESCYLIIKASSVDNVITGKELNATRIGREDGKISFVNDDGDVVYEWGFNNWDSSDLLELDLTTTFEKTDEYPDTYLLNFNAGRELSNYVEFRFDTGMPDTELYVFKMDGGEYIPVGKGKTDANGYMVLNPTDLSNYTISKTDIAAIRKGEVVSENEVEETEEIEEFTPVEIPEPAPVDDFDYTNLMYMILVGIIVGGALIIAVILIVHKSRNR